jgi:hypothetical protein
VKSGIYVKRGRVNVFIVNGIVLDSRTGGYLFMTDLFIKYFNMPGTEFIVRHHGNKEQIEELIDFRVPNSFPQDKRELKNELTSLFHKYNFNRFLNCPVPNIGWNRKCTFIPNGYWAEQDRCPSCKWL